MLWVLGLSIYSFVRLIDWLTFQLVTVYLIGWLVGVRYSGFGFLAVSCIAAHQSGMVLTGSWDASAKLWQDSFCVATMEGHEMAVWAVEFVVTSSGDGDVLLATGSADKTVRIWSKTAQAGKILKGREGDACPLDSSSNLHHSHYLIFCFCRIGHTDVVRGLVSPGPNQLLSCANDASIRQWNVISGDCLTVYYGHTNYIYSIALLGNDSFVSSSEDASVRVWKIAAADSVQTIRLPARSIWAVATLQNGDIVAGGR